MKARTRNVGWLISFLARRGEKDATAVIRVIDTYRASGCITLQVPMDPAAEIVFVEPPRLQPAGITEIVTYVRTRDTGVRELTLVDGDVARDEERVLRPLALDDL